MVLNLTESDLNNPDVLGEKLIQLAEIVVRKHFYASVKEKDDLVSVGVLKALQLIQGNSWTKQKGSFVNYIYSGMRNDMHNYLYHQNKFSIIDIDAMIDTPSDTDVEDCYLSSVSCDIDYGLIHSVCINFTCSFGNDIELLVLHQMSELGYTIRNTCGNIRYDFNTVSRCSPILREQYGKEVEDDVLGRIIGLILWKKRDRELVN